jgi:hypothetical protein
MKLPPPSPDFLLFLPLALKHLMNCACLTAATTGLDPAIFASNF